MDHGFRTEPCFVCRMVAGEVRLPENIIYEDDRALVFLDGYPRAYSYTLVAPKEHKEQVTADFAMEEYLGSAPRGCISTLTAPTRATRMFTGTWSRCLLVCRTKTSRGPGRVGARASSRYLPKIWLLWQDVSTEGSNSSTQPRG